LLRRLLWVDGLVDPHGLGQSGRLGWLADKPLRVLGVGAIQDGRPGGDDLAGTTVVDVGRGEQRDPAVAVLGLYQPKNPWQKARASWMEPNRSGKLGWCLRVLNWLSE